MKKSFTLITLSSAFFLAGASTLLAQSSVQAGMGTFADIVNTFNKTVVQALGALFMSGAVVAFFYGLANFIWGLRGGEPKAISAGKEFMMWALIALFVMFSVYGIIKFFQGTLLQGYSPNTITMPEINYGGSSGSSAGSSGTNQQTEYTCPDGIKKYYNQADYSVVCLGASNNQNPSAAAKSNGEQCTLHAQCASGNCENTPYGTVCAPNP